jgi:uncharacterized membrane protein
MAALLSEQFWIAVQMILIIFLAFLLFRLAKTVRALKREMAGRNMDSDGKQKVLSSEGAEKILSLLEPLIREADSAARLFETQIMEKKILIRQLNDTLDSRIISLNILINRADACLASKTFNASGDPYATSGIGDMQEAILAMFSKGLDAQTISEKLAVARKEVDLVISLKKKFIAMEQES